MSKKKSIIITLLVIVLVIAAVVGTLFFIKSRQVNEVNVFAVADISANDSNISNTQTEGMVRTDKTQSVFISETQQITEIYVTEGQEVKAGDEILAYDTTLTDLELMKKENAVQKLEVQIDQGYDRLAEIKAYKPYVPKPEPEPEPEPEVPENPEITEVPKLIDGEGTKEAPYRFMWDYTCVFTTDFILSLFGENSEVYVQFYVYDMNSLECEKLASWGMYFVKTETGFDFTQYEVDDQLVEEEEPEPEPEPEEDDSSGYTAAEIAQMRTEQEALISSLELELKMAELEYRMMELEVSSGVVTSQIDGVVTLVTDENTALIENSPIVKISGGGGYYIDVSVGEFGLDTIQVGQQVEVYSWYNGTSAVGEICDISKTPTNNYGWTEGNTNISYYPFTVFVSEDVDLVEYDYVSVTYSVSGEEESGIYIEKPFILSENGRSYIYVDNGGLLEKREVSIGKSLWGSYFEIKSGVNIDDYIAFPYGSSIKEGAVTVKSTLDVLYGY